MIRVVKYGKDPATADPLRVTCRNCRSVIEFLPSDVITRHDPRDGDYYEITCPVCKRECTKAIDRRYWAP